MPCYLLIVHTRKLLWLHGHCRPWCPGQQEYLLEGWPKVCEQVRREHRNGDRDIRYRMYHKL